MCNICKKGFMWTEEYSWWDKGIKLSPRIHCSNVMCEI